MPTLTSSINFLASFGLAGLSDWVHDFDFTRQQFDLWLQVRRGYHTDFRSPLHVKIGPLPGGKYGRHCNAHAAGVATLFEAATAASGLHVAAFQPKQREYEEVTCNTTTASQGCFLEKQTSSVTRIVSWIIHLFIGFFLRLSKLLNVACSYYISR